MGIGFAVILSESEAGNVEAMLKEAGETTYRIGLVHQCDGEVVTLIG